METKKNILYFLLCCVCFLLVMAWQNDHAPKTQASVAQTESQVGAKSDIVVPVNTVKNESFTNPYADNEVHQLVTVRTDVLVAKIDLADGAIVESYLLKYPESKENKNKPLLFLQQNNKNIYVSQFGLASGKIRYFAAQPEYVLKDGENNLVVDLLGKNAQGFIVHKKIIFSRNSYKITMTLAVENNSSQPFSTNIYAQFLKNKENGKGVFAAPSFTGISISSPDKHYEKFSFQGLEKENIDKSITSGWLAMQSRYFLSAIVPDKNVNCQYYSKKIRDNLFVAGFYTPFEVGPNSTKTFTSTLYSGPEIQKNLEEVAPNLDLTVDYGWLWFISVAIFWLLKQINRFVGNWGFSIILVTFLIKLAFYKLSESSYRSMGKMKLLAPKMKELQNRYGDNKQQLNLEMMKIYREAKVNPLGGCLPMLIQIPVFIGLYYVLISAVELRQSPFIFWIQDLSVKDPYYILPALMGLTMLIQQKLNPPSPDPTQEKIMLLMPIVFTVLFASFPSGLVLYWFTNNVLSVLQQWYITRKLAK